MLLTYRILQYILQNFRYITKYHKSIILSVQNQFQLHKSLIHITCCKKTQNVFGYDDGSKLYFSSIHQIATTTTNSFRSNKHGDE